MVEVNASNMNSNSVQSDTSQPPGGFQPASPASSWSFHAVVPKREDHEDRNDSGISGSDFHSSPGSDRSENIPGSDQVMEPNYCPMSTVAVNQPTDSVNQQPSALPPIFDMEISENHLKNLQTAFQNKISKENTCDQNIVKRREDFDEIRVPKVNSHGKVRQHKCKYCDFVASVKVDMWEHTKTHIKEEKQLTCPHCPFVTEYKHHLEYHIHNHFGSKPFRCTECSYACVNKSMLNSHLKSHSSVYQYRCRDCSYATKYCHSLKIHLRKYNHSPAMVLNPDGTPNPLPIIDVYGTRRGPRVKPQEQKPAEPPKPEQVLQFHLNALMCSPPPLRLPLGFNCFPNFTERIMNPLIIQNLINRQQSGFHPSPETAEESSVSPQPDEEVLDLSKPEKTSTSRRKGRAFRRSPSEEVSSDEDETTMFSNVEVVQENELTTGENSVTNRPDYACAYCDINFGDPVLYTIHMGYHGYNNPFTCNMCGVKCEDKVAFSLHVARTPHS